MDEQEKQVELKVCGECRGFFVPSKDEVTLLERKVCDNCILLWRQADEIF